MFCGQCGIVDEKFSIFSDFLGKKYGPLGKNLIFLGKYLIFLGKYRLSWEKFRFLWKKSDVQEKHLIFNHTSGFF
jgi:hypothetical protein